MDDVTHPAGGFTPYRTSSVCDNLSSVAPGWKQPGVFAFMSGIDTLQLLSDSEISFTIRCVACTGFDAILGDDMNGIEAIQNHRTIDDACKWLGERATAVYPESEYSKLQRQTDVMTCSQ